MKWIADDGKYIDRIKISKICHLLLICSKVGSILYSHFQDFNNIALSHFFEVRFSSFLENWEIDEIQTKSHKSTKNEWKDVQFRGIFYFMRIKFTAEKSKESPSVA